MNDLAIRAPADAEIIMVERDYEWVVSIIRDGGQPAIPKDGEAQTRGVAVLKFGRGLQWPDEPGARAVAFLLEMPGAAVFFRFQTIADALACRQRLRAERLQDQ